MISREKLRGKELDKDCKTAHTTSHEYGLDDGRVFCYGLEDPSTDEPFEKCKMCNAFIENETPLETQEKRKPIIIKGVQCRPEFADVFNINNERLKLRGE